MRNEPKGYDFTTVIAAVALGAATMYLLDPDKGKRRRAIARDKVRRLVSQAEDFAGKAARDVSHRLDGVRATVRRPFSEDAIPDDLRLIERVRSRMGRVVSHPHAIHVGANRGRIVVSGPILTAEVRPLLHAVRGVPGVADIDDHLIAFDSAGSISSLQGTPARLRARADLLQQNWTPTLRALAIVAGSALALGGLRGRTLARLALAVVGLALGARGATNAPMIGRTGSEGRPRHNGSRRAQREQQASD